MCAQGYALVEFESKAEAQAAIDDTDGQDIFGQVVSVDWAFWNGPSKEVNPRRRRWVLFRLSPFPRSPLQLALISSFPCLALSFFHETRAQSVR